MQYIQGIDKRDDNCVFCTKPSQDDDRNNLILYRGKKTFVLMNLFPYNNGHLMVIPYQHTSDILCIDEETTIEMWDLLKLSKRVLTAAFHPDGFNIGMNIGRGAGAGIDQHIHLHIVPRWNGDTNFMPAIGETKVISQALDATWETLTAHFKSLGSSSVEPLPG
jgi:ATP adenylyltransferase